MSSDAGSESKLDEKRHKKGVAIYGIRGFAEPDEGAGKW